MSQSWSKRCELIKLDLNDQFKQLCGSHTPVTKLLIGDDLPKLVKESGHQGFVKTTDTLQQTTEKIKHFSSHKSSESEAFIMAMSRAMEEITPGPQKEGKTRSTLIFTKPQDQLYFQASLTIVLS